MYVVKTVRESAGVQGRKRKYLAYCLYMDTFHELELDLIQAESSDSMIARTRHVSQSQIFQIYAECRSPTANPALFTNKWLMK